MSESVVYEEYQQENRKRSEVPLTLDWKNAKMVRIHSIRAAVKEILNMSTSLDVVKVNIVGTPSTGKTTLAETIAHLCHDLGKIPYTIKKFTRDDLLKFEDTLARLQPTNHVLIFDDISFLSATAGKRHLDKIQKAFTEIRHLPGGQDVKIISIFNFHYNMAVSKYLRQSDFFIYTSIGSSELDNTINVVGKKYLQTLLNFRKIFQQAITKNEYTFELGKKGQRFTYKFRQPFAPVLFWNNDTCRFVVFPKREWIEPSCPTCLHATDTEQKEMDLKAFDGKVQDKFKLYILKQALRIKLFNMGVNTFGKPVKRCMQYIEEYMKENNFNAEQLAEFYGLKDKTALLYPDDFKKHY